MSLQFVVSPWQLLSADPVDRVWEWKVTAPTVGGSICSTEGNSNNVPLLCTCMSENFTFSGVHIACGGGCLQDACCQSHYLRPVQL